MRKLLLLNVLLIALWIAICFAEPTKTMPPKHFNFPLGNEISATAPTYPYIPNAALNEVVGSTCWDIQSIGSSGNRIVICDNDSKYFGWTSLEGWPYPSEPVYIYYNWADPDGNWIVPQEGLRISENSISAFPSLGQFGRNQGVFAYHEVNEDRPDRIIVAIEWDLPGMGFFDHYIVPNEIFPQNEDYPGICYWPQVAVDCNDNIHIVMHEKTDAGPFRVAYTRSNNEGHSWSDPVVIDTCTVIGSVIDASIVSDRVVIAWPKPHDLASQWHNDIVYVESEDGQSWDFENDIVNITDYANDDDSLWAYTDLDALLDYDDIVHLMWNAQWVTDQGVYWRTYLFHYNNSNENIVEVYHYPDSLFNDICGAWNRPICKMSMDVRANQDDIFAVWTQFDTSDVSAAGFGNGDIYMSSAIGGTRWWRSENITDTHSPGCFPGNCNSENWASMGKLIDEPSWGVNLQLIYINDKDAGSIIMDEGNATENPVFYSSYFSFHEEYWGYVRGYVTEVDGETPIEGAIVTVSSFSGERVRDTTNADGIYELNYRAGFFNSEASKEGYRTEIKYGFYINPEWPSHCNFQLERTVDINPEQSMPYSFRLNQNYPNPFNASTVISFDLKEYANVKIDVLDITGAKVATLIDEPMTAGNHQVTWNAADVASGVYYYKLTAGDISEIKQAVLIK